MIIRREEPWGEILYDTVKHRFSTHNNLDIDVVPYSKEPVLLNIDLTLKCNMDCPHCVAKDFDELVDLHVTDELINWINDSPFLVIVITGGEPLLPEFEENLIILLRKIKKKGLIIDTNGTIIPSKSVVNAIKETNTLVRISMDSVSADIEGKYRKYNASLKSVAPENVAYYNKKFDLIDFFKKEKILFAIQTVLSESNKNEIELMVDKFLSVHSIRKWYIQKFIPAHKCISENLALSKEEYNIKTKKLKTQCKKHDIECITKKDLRHNCVFLLVGNGTLYTQSQEPGKKIPIATIYDKEIEYFDFVSAGDHAERYYG